MLLATCRELPTGPGWILEPKWDGYRCVVRIDRGRAELWTRHGTSLTERLPTLASSLAKLPPGTVLDAELVALARRADGSVGQDWDALGAVCWRGQPDTSVDLRLVCFDCLKARGELLHRRPWSERRDTLERVLADGPPMISLTTVHAADAGVHRQLTALGFEGSVVKRADSRYTPGQRSRAWLKLKERRETTVLVHFPGRDRRTGKLDRAAFTEPGIAGLQWASIASADVHAAMEAGASEVVGRIAFSHRSARGRAREARLIALGA
jgi:bifunctional non-homologous end joining protein LigD